MLESSFHRQILKEKIFYVIGLRVRFSPTTLISESFAFDHNFGPLWNFYEFVSPFGICYESFQNWAKLLQNNSIHYEIVKFPHNNIKLLIKAECFSLVAAVIGIFANDCRTKRLIIITFHWMAVLRYSN